MSVEIMRNGEVFPFRKKSDGTSRRLEEMKEYTRRCIHKMKEVTRYL